MTWYAAHIISYVRFLDGNQDKYPIWENIVLIEAESPDEAYEKAKKIGQDHYDGTATGSGNLRWDGRPGVWVFAGIRKVIRCQDTTATEVTRIEEGERPIHGTEITYSELEVSSEEALTKLLNGDPVIVLYEE